MKSAVERRQSILEVVSDRRQIKIEELAARYGVNERTIRRDVEALSCSYPIVSVSGNGGGIKALDGWYLSHRYLHENQEALLLSLLPGLSPEDQNTMKQILTAFAKPKEEDKQ